jgi:choline kinase
MTQPTSAVILAAGVGKRLSSVLPDKPKGFIELAGTAIVERSIKQLLSIGIQRITIVTGYASAYYEKLAGQYPHIVLVHNPDYAVFGSMFSLYCARNYMHGTFLLLESDLVYETRALTELVACPKANAILMSGFTQSGDEVFISTEGPSVLKLSKDQNKLYNITGELVGIVKISPEMFDAMIKFAETTFQKCPQLYYEECINGITAHLQVFHHKVDDLIWAEIDTPEHLQRVVHYIVPQLSQEWEITLLPDTNIPSLDP